MSNFEIKTRTEIVARRGLCEILSVTVDPDLSKIEVKHDGNVLTMNVETACALAVALGQAIYASGKNTVEP